MLCWVEVTRGCSHRRGECKSQQLLHRGSWLTDPHAAQARTYSPLHCSDPSSLSSLRLAPPHASYTHIHTGTCWSTILMRPRRVRLWWLLQHLMQLLEPHSRLACPTLRHTSADRCERILREGLYKELCQQLLGAVRFACLCMGRRRSHVACPCWLLPAEPTHFMVLHPTLSPSVCMQEGSVSPSAHTGAGAEAGALSVPKKRPRSEEAEAPELVLKKANQVRVCVCVSGGARMQRC